VDHPGFTPIQIIPVSRRQDARNPKAYRMLVGMCDCIFMDVAQPDQARILAINAKQFLKTDGWFMISIKVRPLPSQLDPSKKFLVLDFNLPSGLQSSMKKHDCGFYPKVANFHWFFSRNLPDFFSNQT